MTRFQRLFALLTGKPQHPDWSAEREHIKRQIKDAKAHHRPVSHLYAALKSLTNQELSR